MSPGFLEGMCLAAIVAEDRDGAAAGGGLSPRLRGALSEALGAHAALDRDARRAAVRRWAEALSRVDRRADLPPTARARLAADVPRDVGRRWLDEAPTTRAGYRELPGLRVTLRRYAGPTPPDAEAEERATGAALGDDARERWSSLGLGEDDRLLGALALGAAGEVGGDGLSRGWRRIGAAIAEMEEAGWPG